MHAQVRAGGQSGSPGDDVVGEVERGQGIRQRDSAETLRQLRNQGTGTR